MAKNLFKRIEIADIGKPIVVSSQSFEPISLTGERLEEKKEEFALEESRYSEALKREFADRRKELELEIENRRKGLDKELKEIRERAENWAFAKVKQTKEETQQITRSAEEKSQEILSSAEEKSQEILAHAQVKSAQVLQEAHTKGYEEAKEEGYQSGKEEVERLIIRLNNILSSVIQKRNQIVEESESQIIDIVISIARKVVKSISESQKRVVYDNITEALKDLKGASEVTIRVNTEDLHMTARHKKEFIQMIEGVEQVRILEDNTIDHGGCYVSTEFGSIDARISTQLANIEEEIKRMTPMKEQEL